MTVRQGIADSLKVQAEPPCGEKVEGTLGKYRDQLVRAGCSAKEWTAPIK